MVQAVVIWLYKFAKDFVNTLENIFENLPNIQIQCLYIQYFLKWVGPLEAEFEQFGYSQYWRIE